jgi:hypothetical protein
MSFLARLAPILSAAAVLLWFVTPSVATAQDVMELDLAFKSGRLVTAPGQEAASEPQRVSRPQKRV